MILRDCTDSCDSSDPGDSSDCKDSIDSSDSSDSIDCSGSCDSRDCKDISELTRSGSKSPASGSSVSVRVRLCLSVSVHQRDHAEAPGFPYNPSRERIVDRRLCSTMPRDLDFDFNGMRPL